MWSEREREKEAARRPSSDARSLASSSSSLGRSLVSSLTRSSASAPTRSTSPASNEPSKRGSGGQHPFKFLCVLALFLCLFIAYYRLVILPRSLSKPKSQPRNVHYHNGFFYRIPAEEKVKVDSLATIATTAEQQRAFLPSSATARENEDVPQRIFPRNATSDAYGTERLTAGAVDVEQQLDSLVGDKTKLDNTEGSLTHIPAASGELPPLPDTHMPSPKEESPAPSVQDSPVQPSNSATLDSQLPEQRVPLVLHHNETLLRELAGYPQEGGGLSAPESAQALVQKREKVNAKSPFSFSLSSSDGVPATLKERLEGTVAFASWDNKGEQPKDKGVITNWLRILEFMVCPGKISVDVGAHIGDSTVPIALMTHPGVTLAFEASKPFELLPWNLRLNPDLHAIPLKAGVASEKGTRKFQSGCGGCNGGFATGKENPRFFTLSEVPTVRLEDELVENKALRSLWGEVSHKRQREAEGEESRASILRNVKFIKTDIEKHDVSILRSLKGGELLQYRPVFFVEWHDSFRIKSKQGDSICHPNAKDLFNAIEEIGYVPFDPFNLKPIPSCEGRYKTSDLLLLPQGMSIEGMKKGKHCEDRANAATLLASSTEQNQRAQTEPQNSIPESTRKDSQEEKPSDSPSVSVTVTEAEGHPSNIPTSSGALSPPPFVPSSNAKAGETVEFVPSAVRTNQTSQVDSETEMPTMNVVDIPSPPKDASASEKISEADEDNPQSLSTKDVKHSSIAGIAA
uniref:Methyltransferase FkbM domain-containing protein n=1 Tax=Chromera velia CCMP2878 TaxID=1169474 RepID=A0A0G4IBW1_9ALVE|eukprot:Cvel_12952.t1-p1 / transcript=Cvel_12952.t1 / gene=Cvel_12952 / organism=Chromera_velia_CCMP2878 / gene_product=hypothetical protein / transcript_product=hypothetical protein / location=Cvel_scaffold867:4558-7568(-) / protein_length=743 / sequence_SO=supercontig / SO=protein_coding / is_pseudo=false